MYAKLIDNTLYPAPAALTVAGRVHYHPSDALYEAQGYLPIVDTPQPETAEGETIKHYAARYEEQGGQIVKVWEEAETPAPPQPTTLDILNEIGVAKTVEQSDKLGHDWVTYRIGSVVVRRDYVPQADPRGTADNPIPYTEGMALIPNAYYTLNGAQKVWMGAAGAVAGWDNSDFVEF